MCSHPEGVAAGGKQSCQLTVSLAPKVTFSENIVLLPLHRSKKGTEMGEKEIVTPKNEEKLSKQPS